MLVRWRPPGTTGQIHLYTDNWTDDEERHKRVMIRVVSMINADLEWFFAEGTKYNFTI